MERVIWDGNASVFPEHLIPDEEVREFIEVCKYLDCTILVTESGDEYCYRADLPESILETGYIEYRNKITVFEIKNDGVKKDTKTETINPASTANQGTTMTNNFEQSINNASINAANAALASAGLTNMTAPQTSESLWDKPAVRYGVYAAGAVVVGVAGYYAYKHFTQKGEVANADIPSA